MATVTDRTTAAAHLKELYTLPPVRVLNDKSWIHDNIVKTTPDLNASGDKFVWPVTIRRALGRGSRGDGGTLPTAVAEVVLEASESAKLNYYPLEWSEALEESTKNKEGAFENIVTLKMKNVATDMAKELNRQWFNASKGALATIPTGTGSTNTVHTVDTSQYLQVGDIVDVLNAAGTSAVSSSNTISAISGTSVTFGTTFDSTDGDIVVLAGNVDTTTGNTYESAGLRHMADDGRTLHNINSTTYPEWDGKVVAANDGVIGESLIEQLDDEVGARGAGEVDFSITTRGIRRRLADEFASQRRYLNEKATQIKAGYKIIEVNDVETVIDDDAPKGYMFRGRRDVLRVAKLTEPGFIESAAGGGAKIELKDGSTAGTKKAVFQAWYRYHVNLICTDPTGLGVIPDGDDDF